MNINDNHTRRRNAMLSLISGVVAFPVACHCGSHKTYPDLEHRPDGSRVLFVWCVDCGAEGPREATHDAAVSAWNQSIGFLSAWSHGGQRDKLH